MAELLKVRKRDGRIVAFDKSKIANAVYKAFLSVGRDERERAEEIAEQVERKLKEENKKEVHVEEIQDVVEKTLIANNLAEIAKNYILYRKRREEIREEKKRILNKDKIDEIDKRFDLNALKVLAARYLKKNENGEIVETPKELFERVAIHAALPSILYDEKIFDKNCEAKENEEEKFEPEKHDKKVKIGKYALNKYHLEALKRLYDRLNKSRQMKLSWSEFFKLLKSGEFNKYEKEIENYFNLMVEKKFLPNTPALINFGRVLGMGSACFVLDIEDSIESIMETLKKAAIIFKCGGGVGYNFSKLRPEGDVVRSTSGIASGPVSFMTLFDKMTDVIKQGGCISTDTLIRTNKGIIKIGELLNCRDFSENPTSYCVFDGESFNHVLLAKNNGYSEVYKIKTDLGIEIKATYNHLVATVGKDGKIKWKKVADLKEGDWLITVLNGHIGNEIRLPKLWNQHFNSNKLKIPEKLTRELAELLGLYMADGCFSNGRLIFSINAKNKELYEEIKKLMNKVFGLKVGEVRDRKTYKDIVFFSKDLERYFEKLGWKKTSSKNAFVPTHIFRAKEEIICSFLKGLFEGDGCVHTDGYPILSSSSKILVQQVQQLLLSLGIVSRLSYIPKEKLKNHKGGDMYKLLLLTERGIKKFKDKIGFISEEKNKKINFKPKKIEYCDLIPNLKELFSKYYTWVGRGCGPGRSKKGANLKYYKAVYHYLKGERNLTRKNLKKLIQKFEFLAKDETLRNIVDDKYFYTRIKKIEKEENVYTMEIEVPESGYFVANGILVHNVRRGANIGILNIDHPDIEKFIVAKRKNLGLKNFNISVFIKPEFWEYYEKNKPYPLINPRNKKIVKYVDPAHLLNLIAYQAWESAEPGVIFGDNVNKYNPFLESLGPIETVNPCGEVLLYPYESCNLGSINVSAFAYRKGNKTEFDWDEFKRVILLATRFLDNVIDINKYPLPEIEEKTLKTRKIGLGIMGLADLLFELEIPYNSVEGYRFMEKIMEFLNYYSKVASIELAKERGAFPYYDKSFYPKGKLPFKGFEERENWNLDWEKIVEDTKKYKIRNGFTIVCAPTGSISMIAGCSAGVEPAFALVYEKKVSIGTFYYVNPVFEKIMRMEKLFSEELIKEICKNNGSVQEASIPEKFKKIFVITTDIEAEDHIKALASITKWTDSSISKTINLPENAKIEDVKKAILLAHELGCKDITIYRYRSIEGVYETKVELKKEPSSYEVVKNKDRCPNCGEKLISAEGCKICKNCGYSVCG